MNFVLTMMNFEVRMRHPPPPQRHHQVALPLDLFQRAPRRLLPLPHPRPRSAIACAHKQITSNHSGIGTSCGSSYDLRCGGNSPSDRSKRSLSVKTDGFWTALRTQSGLPEGLSRRPWRSYLAGSTGGSPRCAAGHGAPTAPAASQAAPGSRRRSSLPSYQQRWH